jgi:hypothetical protein
VSALATTLRRSLGLAAAALCLGGVLSAPAGARELEVPSFLAPGRNPDLSPSSVPGGRPFEVINVFTLNQTPVLEGIAGPAENVRDLRFDLPPGMVADAAGFPRCSQEAFSARGCPTATQLGTAALGLAAGASAGTVPVFNIAPPPGMAARFAFRASGSAVQIDFHIRGGSDYGATAQLHGLSAAAGLLRSEVRIWGVPGDPLHDAERFAGNGVPAPGPYPEAPPYRPLISNPTSCDGPLVTSMEVSSWQAPAKSTSAAPFEAPPMSGCNQLDFSPEIEAKPTTDLADSPSGLDLHLHIPQNQDPDGAAAAQLRTAKIVLPGLSVNPAAAGGLGACTPAQIGYTGPASERQLLRYDMPPVSFSGSFTVSLGGQSTAQIPATAGAAQVRAALETLPGLTGNVSLRGAPGGWLISFSGALAGTDVAQLEGTVTDNPRQLLAVTATGGTYKLGFGGTETAPLPFDASAADIQAALRAIPALGLGNLYPGNVFVVAAGSEESTRFYQMIFAGDLAGTQPALGSTSALTGPGAKVEITAPKNPPAPHSLSVATLGGNAPGTAQFDAAAPACPDASKIGTVRVDAPAIADHPLFGHLYLASPGRNPFGSLLAVYIVIEDPATGLVAKLPGRVDTDAAGSLVATFAEAPQLPFEDLQLELFKGAAAPLKTGLGCALYTVGTQLTPWSAPEAGTARPKDSFRISQGAGGGACPAAAPDLASFEAGTIEPSAGAYSPFVLKLSRPDGARALGGVDTTLPEGLLARLAGRSACPDGALAAAAAKSGGAERSAPSCPASSRVGSVAIAAGAGPAPYNLTGSAYLAGPYKGAPLSIATVTPALAGPFDLGTVLNRTALYVDPTSTRVHVVSDPLPRSLAGIDTDLRSVALTLDAANFVKNPTSCNPLALEGPQSSHFQLGDCSKLAFKPKLELALKGDTKRGAHPALRASITYPGKGDSADIAALSVSLPKALGLDKSHIKAICATAVLSACPPASAIGTAKATTPLLADPLAGKAYLRKGTGRLPDLAIDLRSGPIDVVVSGRIATSKAGAVSIAFEDLPDAPISRFSLELAGAKKGLFKASAELCAHPARAKAQIDGQNASSADQSPVLDAGCKKAGKAKGKAEKRSERGRGK